MELKKMLVLVVSFALAVLSGCAHDGLVVKDVSLANYQSKEGAPKGEVLVPDTPHHTLGILESEAIRKGKFKTADGVFADIRFGEYYPGRISWIGWGIRRDGTEFICQTALYKVEFDGIFHEVVIAEDLEPYKTIVLSTRMDYAYDLNGNEFPIERDKFLNDREYRRKLISEKGTRFSESPEAPADFARILKSWNKYETPEGVLLSPLGEEQVKFIASINPSYNLGEKLVATGRFGLSMDYIGTIAGLAIDVLRASRAPETGWDFKSQLPNRRNMAVIIAYVLQFKQELVKKINAANMQMYMATVEISSRVRQLEKENSELKGKNQQLENENSKLINSSKNTANKSSRR